METEAGGLAWLLMVAGFPILIAAALMFGIHQWRLRRKTPAEQHAQDRATDELYEKAE